MPEYFICRLIYLICQHSLFLSRGGRTPIRRSTPQGKLLVRFFNIQKPHNRYREIFESRRGGTRTRDPQTPSLVR